MVNPFKILIGSNVNIYEFRDGFISEEIEEDYSSDLDMFVDSVLQMPIPEIEQKQTELVGKFPNTYTFTKNIGEKLLRKHRGNMPLVIIRPSIIGCSYHEPAIGWVDGISAATAVYLVTILGLNKDLYGKINNISDQIPVDYVASLIIASTADNMNKDKLMVYHWASSSRNPVTWSETIRYFWPYVARNPFEKRLSFPSFDMYRSQYVQGAVFYVKRQLPANLYYYAVKAIGNEKMKKDSERYIKILDQWKNLNRHFGHFTVNEWIYDTYNSFQLASRMSKEDLEVFPIDIKNVDWREYFPGFTYGMQKFLMKEQAERIDGPRHSVINWKPDYFSDISWIFKHGKPQKVRDITQIKKIVLNSESVKDSIRELVRRQKESSKLSSKKLIEVQNTKANEILDRITARLTHNRMKVMGYVIHKAFLKMYEKIIVNKAGMKRVLELDKHCKGNVVYVPTHRSYIDFLIISYVLFAHNAKVPHIWAADDFLNISIVSKFLRSSGAFFMKRSFKDDILYKSIFTEYVQSLLNDNHSIEFFLEGTRARSGKMLNPKFGILNILWDAYFKEKVEDLHFIPITVNYSRVLEGESFSPEILGESKVKESLSRIVNAMRYVNINFGQIYVEFTEPISFKDYASKLIVEQNLQPKVNKADKKLITSSLGQFMTDRLSNNLIIMPIAIWASILLMNRKGISEDEFIKQVDLLIKVII